MLEKLMQSIFTRVAALLASKWSGEITVKLSINQGGISRVRFLPDEELRDWK